MTYNELQLNVPASLLKDGSPDNFITVIYGVEGTKVSLIEYVVFPALACLITDWQALQKEAQFVCEKRETKYIVGYDEAYENLKQSINW